MKEFDKNLINHVKQVSQWRSLPQFHKNYLPIIKNKYNFIPKTIYDIGSCVLQWTYEAKDIWPDSEIILFDATDIFEPLYKEEGYKYHIGVLSNESNKEVDFYQNNDLFAGNSYYKENTSVYNNSHIVKLKTETLNSVVKRNSFNLPDLIKMDVQGSELDVLLGSTDILNSCKHLIIELRHTEYNLGSPEKRVIVDYLSSIGFENQGLFCDNGPDGDYHFINNELSIK